MTKYICVLLVLFFSCASNYGLKEVELKEVKIVHKQFAKLIDSLVVLEKRCDYYNDKGSLFIGFYEDLTISFGFDNEFLTFEKYLVDYYVCNSNGTNVIINNLFYKPELFKKLNSKTIVLAYLSDPLKKPRLMSFGSEYSERYFYVKDDKIIFKYETKICH